MSRHLRTFTRRQFAATFLLASLVGTRAQNEAQAQEPRKLPLRVRAGEFGADEADIKAVLRSAAGEIWRHCPHTRFDAPGFEIYREEKHPIMQFERSDDGWIVIGLATDGSYWARYAYQFAHEFCHALAGYANDSRRVWRSARQANKWLEEALCETASLFALRAMGRTWQTAAPYPNWKKYAAALTQYAQKRLDDPQHQLPAGATFAEWLWQARSGIAVRIGVRKSGARGMQMTSAATFRSLPRILSLPPSRA